jgi:copper resistance protein B
VLAAADSSRHGAEPRCPCRDLQGYYGTPTSKLWLKSEGEAALGEGVEDAEVQALWSRAVAPYWDLQLGVRQDLAGQTDTHAVVGIQGLAPYLFEIDAALFLSQRGDLTARIEAEVDQRITQKLILQPRVEVSLAAQDNPARKQGAGVDKIEAGLRLRYEIVPEFAPYIGIEQGWKLGGSARYARLAGEDPSVTSVVMGVRFWF